MSKYELNSAEERYQPGSGNLVLANKLGIIDVDQMEALESGLLLMLYEQLFIEGQPPVALTFESHQRLASSMAGECVQLGGEIA